MVKRTTSTVARQSKKNKGTGKSPRNKSANVGARQSILVKTNRRECVYYTETGKHDSIKKGSKQRGGSGAKICKCEFCFDELSRRRIPRMYHHHKCTCPKCPGGGHTGCSDCNASYEKIRSADNRREKILNDVVTCLECYDDLRESYSEASRIRLMISPHVSVSTVVQLQRYINYGGGGVTLLSAKVFNRLRGILKRHFDARQTVMKNTVGEVEANTMKAIIAYEYETGQSLPALPATLGNTDTNKQKSLALEQKPSLEEIKNTDDEMEEASECEGGPGEGEMYDYRSDSDEHVNTADEANNDFPLQSPSQSLRANEGHAQMGFLDFFGSSTHETLGVDNSDLWKSDFLL